MDQQEIETRIKNIDERTTRIEQILPTLATNEDFKVFATKEDLKTFATREDLEAFPTRDEMMAIVREDGERTRLHFDVVAEAMKADIKRIAEGHAVVDARVDGVRAELKEDLAIHDKRITKLEAGASKRR
jgi:hydroxylamine reductase (hybrid-cluster protein)